jgi:hypothetical protein
MPQAGSTAGAHPGVHLVNSTGQLAGAPTSDWYTTPAHAGPDAVGLA